MWQNVFRPPNISQFNARERRNLPAQLENRRQFEKAVWWQEMVAFFQSKLSEKEAPSKKRTWPNRTSALARKENVSEPAGVARNEPARDQDEWRRHLDLQRPPGGLSPLQLAQPFQVLTNMARVFRAGA
ncbi:hypothetical protein Ddc_21541 [Ditylenchus destructor]|nr:hypothetical protein Ddc_21541 [Ditylenchus destructor]